MLELLPVVAYARTPMQWFVRGMCFGATKADIIHRVQAGEKISVAEVFEISRSIF